MATELAKAYVQIVPSAKGLGKSLIESVGGEMPQAGEKAGGSLGSSLIAKAKAVVAAAGFGAFIKNSLDAGGAIQQSFGGLDTLYGKASEAAKDYSLEAVKAGISANQYAEQAVSFGAALKAAYGGDVALAAKAANTAIMDMADNSAKMGTDLGSVQAAYQGFAKGQYQLLDNLKLGYGGTKTEMERLLKDATKLTGVKYDINNLGDVYDAIHAVQVNLGLTGVAAAEASETFSGSFGAMKAAAENVMAALSAEEMDITPAFQNLLDTASTFVFNNAIPMLFNMAKSAAQVIPGALIDTLPAMMESGMSMMDSLIEGISGNFSLLSDSAEEGIYLFLGRIVEDSSLLVMQGFELIGKLGNGLINGYPKLIESAGRIMDGLLDDILWYGPMVLSEGFSLIGSLAKGLINNMPAIAGSVAKVIAKLLSTFASNFPSIAQSGISMLGRFLAGVISAIPQIPGYISRVISSVKNEFSKYNWSEIGKNILEGIGRGIRNAIGSVVSSAKDAAGRILGGLKEKLGIASPSKITAGYGRFLDLGMAKGIDDNLGYVDRAVTALKDVTVSGLNSGGNVAATNSDTKMDQMLDYLCIIANKDFSLPLDGRELKRGLRARGVVVR